MPDIYEIAPKAASVTLREDATTAAEALDILQLPVKAVDVVTITGGNYRYKGQTYNSWVRFTNPKTSQVFFVAHELVTVKFLEGDWVIVDLPYYTFIEKREVAKAMLDIWQGILDATREGLRNGTPIARPNADQYPPLAEESNGVESE